MASPLGIVQLHVSETLPTIRRVQAELKGCRSIVSTYLHALQGSAASGEKQRPTAIVPATFHRVVSSNLITAHVVQEDELCTTWGESLTRIGSTS